ncbi:MAG: DUF1295 domain-containing protein [Lachnospiraceae bacterium]|nr:DUF1295 domain-containing protein [Lachnospiraceae bacterium]
MFFVIFVVAMIFSAVGFKKYIWFISIGYGFAIAGIGGALLISFREGLSLWTALYCVLFLIYGVRLGGYLAYRETDRTTYNKKMKGEIKESDDVSFITKLLIWVFAALLYACESAPLLFRLQTGHGTDVFLVIGVILSAAGIVVETLSDVQKQQAKRVAPDSFVSTGLFSLVRCPNYLGELMMWTGVFISGLSVYNGLVMWLVALAGYIGIVYVMFSGARRLELSQEHTYGQDPAYREYVKKTPIMIPFIPLYSVMKYKWLIA